MNLSAEEYAAQCPIDGKDALQMMEDCLNSLGDLFECLSKRITFLCHLRECILSLIKGQHERLTRTEEQGCDFLGHYE